jgi:hypothetical protein
MAAAGTATAEQMQQQMIQMTDEMRQLRDAMVAQAQARTVETAAVEAAAATAAVQIRELADARIQDVGRMAELREQVLNRRQSAAPAVSLIDTKGIGKPKAFVSKAGEWPDFSFKYLNFAGSAFPSVKKLTTWAQMETVAMKKRNSSQTMQNMCHSRSTTALVNLSKAKLWISSGTSPMTMDLRHGAGCANDSTRRP